MKTTMDLLEYYGPRRGKGQRLRKINATFPLRTRGILDAMEKRRNGQPTHLAL